jgi:hypothetical protein
MAISLEREGVFGIRFDSTLVSEHNSQRRIDVASWLSILIRAMPTRLRLQSFLAPDITRVALKKWIPPDKMNLDVRYSRADNPSLEQIPDQNSSGGLSSALVGERLIGGRRVTFSRECSHSSNRSRRSIKNRSCDTWSSVIILRGLPTSSGVVI